MKETLQPKSIALLGALAVADLALERKEYFIIESTDGRSSEGRG